MENINKDTSIEQSNITSEYENKYDSNIAITKKFTASKWNAIEKPLSEMDLQHQNGMQLKNH